MIFKGCKKRLYLSGAGENTPPDGLRRARGIHATETDTVRSRWGSTLLYARNAHSITRFADVRFLGVGTKLYREDEVLQEGLSGDPLYFERMAPQPAVDDYLFCSGGGELFKVDKDGAVSAWGIEPPSDGFTATKGTSLVMVLDNMEGSDLLTRWSATNTTLSASSTFFQQGAQSLKMVVASEVKGIATQSVALDMTKFDTGEDISSIDSIVVWVRLENPANLDYMQIDFSVGDTAFANQVYTRRLDKEYTAPSYTPTSGYVNAPDIQTTYSEGEPAIYPNDEGQLVRQLDQPSLPVEFSAWKKIRVAKNSFSRQGDDDDVGWADVQAVRFTVAATEDGSVTAYFDAFKVQGGYGVQGRYRYKVTHRNSVTGSRSNANETYVEVKNVMRQPIVLNGLPGSNDSQVDEIEIWRTVGNGALFFRAARLPHGTGTWTDIVTDSYYMHDTHDVIGTEELPTDNLIPESTFTVCCGPYNASMFWLNSADGTRGRVYYSPIGRPESNAGFIEVSHDDDPLQALVRWNSNVWAFSESRVFQIVGLLPYQSREVFGVPGVTETNRRTIACSPYGIFYQAVDGVRLFDGRTAELVGLDSVGLLFRGEDRENLVAFEGVVGVCRGDEYIVSDGRQTLAYHFELKSWRDMGGGLGACYFEPDTKKIIATLNAQVVVLEDEGVDDDAGVAVPFEVETAHFALPEDLRFDISFMELDANLNGQTISVWIVVNGEAELVGSYANTQREYIPIPVSRNARRFGVRLTGSLMAPIEIHKVIVEMSPSKRTQR